MTRRRMIKLDGKDYEDPPTKRTKLSEKQEEEENEDNDQEDGAASQPNSPQLMKSPVESDNEKNESDAEEEEEQEEQVDQEDPIGEAPSKDQSSEKLPELEGSSELKEKEEKVPMVDVEAKDKAIEKWAEIFRKQAEAIINQAKSDASATNDLDSTLKLMVQQVTKEFDTAKTMSSPSPLSSANFSSSSSSSSSSITLYPAPTLQEKKEPAELLPKHLSRDEYRNEKEPSYYKALVEIHEDKKVSSTNMDVLDDEIEKLRSSMEQAFATKSKGCATVEDYITKYSSSNYKLFNEIKSHASDLHQEELLEKIQEKIDEINSELEKGYQESIMYMHPDYTMEKYCKSAGIECHASSNLNIKQSKIYVKQTKETKKSPGKTTILFNNPTGAHTVFDIYCRNMPVISPAGIVDDYCEAYPNGNFGKKFSPKYPGHSQFNVAVTEGNPSSIYGGSWAERLGREGVVTPYSMTCNGFDKLYELNQHFTNLAWETAAFAAKDKEELKTVDTSVREEYTKMCEIKKTKQKEEEVEALIKSTRKSHFRMALKCPFKENDRGVRSFKGIHEIYRFETEDEKKDRKTKPYQPFNELDRRVYYYPNMLKREPNANGVVSDAPLKRKYAISLRRSECPLFRAVTYDEYIEDKKNGLVDHKYKPFKPVPLEEAYIRTDDVVIALFELVPDSANCRLKLIYKAFIWIGESGKLDFSYKPVTKDDDFSKFFYCATKYTNRLTEKQDHEMPCNPYTLQEDINHLESILKEEDEFKNKPSSS